MLGKLDLVCVRAPFVRRTWIAPVLALLVATSGCRDSSAPERLESPLLGTSGDAAQFETWQVVELAGAGCTPLQANAISDDETVVGICRPGKAGLRAYRWKNGVLTVLPFRTQGYSNALGVNNLGYVVGDVQPNPPQPDRAFVWAPDGTVTILPKLDADIQSDRAWGINSAGTIVGEGCCPTRAIAWTLANNTWTASEIGTLGAEYDRAVAINDAGMIVGTSTDAGGTSRAWRAQLGGPMELLGSLGGNAASGSGAGDINRAGTIVGGGLYFTTSMYFMWKATTGMQNMGIDGGNYHYGHSFGASLSDKERVAVTMIGPRPVTYRGTQYAVLPLPPGTSVATATDVNNCGTVSGYAGHGANGALIWRRLVGGRPTCD